MKTLLIVFDSLTGGNVAVALAYLFLGIETHGQPIALDTEERSAWPRPGLAPGN